MEITEWMIHANRTTGAYLSRRHYYLVLQTNTLTLSPESVKMMYQVTADVSTFSGFYFKINFGFCRYQIIVKKGGGAITFWRLFCKFCFFMRNLAPILKPCTNIFYEYFLPSLVLQKAL